MPSKTRKIEVRFPLAGVGRRIGHWDYANARPPYPAPWAVNERPLDPLATRMRGGSRPGLTKHTNARTYAAEIDDMLVAAPAGSYLPIFSTEDFTGNGSVYNTSCWAASLDFTGCAWYGVDSGDNSISNSKETGTLISPRHSLVAHHANHVVGDKITWVAADGTRYRRTILGASDAIGGGTNHDVQVIYYGKPGLDGDDVAAEHELPDSLANYRVLPADYEDDVPEFPKYSVTSTNVSPIIVLDQERQALVRDWYAVLDFLDGNFYMRDRNASVGNRASYTETIVSGDSSFPLFVLMHGELVLLAARLDAQTGPFVPVYIDEINAAMTALHGDNTYQLEEWSLPSGSIGTDVADILPLATVDAVSGASSVVVVAADGALGVVEDGTLTTDAGHILLESLGAILTEAGDFILLGGGTVPDDCYLVGRGQIAYAISRAGVTTLNPDTREVETLTATVGTIPTNCTFGAVYRDSLYLAGDDNAIYKSRQGDFTDWDYGADVEDAGAAMVFQLGEGMELGAMPTALIPHHDSAMLCATADSLWVLRGDPVAGGTRINISREVGIIGPRAWAQADNSVVFLAGDGLYVIRGNGEGLKLISDERIPADLLDIDMSTNTVTLEYRHSERGVYIFVTRQTPPADGTTSHWFFDLQGGGFWPDFFQDDHEPTASCRLGDDVLVAGTDGVLRQIGGDDDDGTDVESHILLGPLRLAPTTDVSVLRELEGSLGNSSGDVTWYIVTGDSAEEAAENAKTAVETYLGGDTSGGAAYASATGTFSAGRNRKKHPRIRGAWFVVWLKSSNKWAYEWLALKGIVAGRYR